MANKSKTTPEEAVEECIPWLEKGALPMRIEADALKNLRDEHLEQFKKVWDSVNWDDDKCRVNELAEYIGIFARFFAETAPNSPKRVDWPTLKSARDLVSERCDRNRPEVRFKYCPGPSAS